MQNLIKKLRSSRLCADESSEPPTATCLRAANAIEKLNEMGRADLAARQVAEQKLLDAYAELENTRIRYSSLVSHLTEELAKHENKTTNINSEGIASTVSAAYSANDGTSDAQPKVDEQA